MQETWIRSLAWEDPLEKGKAPHSSILAWRIPWTVQIRRSQRDMDTTERLSLSHLAGIEYIKSVSLQVPLSGNYQNSAGISNGLQPTRLLCARHSPGKNTGVGSHSLLQKIFPSQGSNPGFLYCRWPLYHLAHQGSPLWYIFTRYSVLMLLFGLLWWLK